MTNYEKAMELLKQGKAEKHRTFEDTGIICITKVNHAHYGLASVQMIQ